MYEHRDDRGVPTRESKMPASGDTTTTAALSAGANNAVENLAEGVYEVTPSAAVAIVNSATVASATDNAIPANTTKRYYINGAVSIWDAAGGSTVTFVKVG